MARKAGEVTKAIRKLCVQSNFKITHAEARPLLAKLGFKIAKEPADKSEDYKKWEAKRKGHYPKGNDERLKAFYLKFLKAADLPLSSLNAIMEEDAVHRAFCNERNNFDVTKHNWQRIISSHVAHKAKRGKLAAVKENFGTKKTKKDDEILVIIKEFLAVGGAKAIEKRLVELDAERIRLQKILSKARNIRALLPNSAA
jgi:hypothetical protein